MQNSCQLFFIYDYFCYCYRITSIINGREYVPFMSIDLREKFAYPISFSDKDGKLALSPKQKAAFARWVRPEDISSRPVLIEVIDCFSIKQVDCITFSNDFFSQKYFVVNTLKKMPYFANSTNYA